MKKLYAEDTAVQLLIFDKNRQQRQCARVRNKDVHRLGDPFPAFCEGLPVSWDSCCSSWLSSCFAGSDLPIVS